MIYISVYILTAILFYGLIHWCHDDEWEQVDDYFFEFNVVMAILWPYTIYHGIKNAITKKND
jgi:hypothetical protein